MESIYKIYPESRDDFERVWRDYERVFGERPPEGYDLDDHGEARLALECADLRARFGDVVSVAPVSEWPSRQRKQKRADANPV